MASERARRLDVEYQRLRQACTDTTGVAHPLGETITLKGVELRCVQTAIILF